MKVSSGEDAFKILNNYDYPGNIRKLENIISTDMTNKLKKLFIKRRILSYRVEVYENITALLTINNKLSKFL
ncbi:hypothetical protein [Lutispora sp.]|uniref:hypothetical protein n=1 Tax=Lutispora sp. TaxID=2828727 RepID=UPI003FA53430